MLITQVLGLLQAFVIARDVQLQLVIDLAGNWNHALNNSRADQLGVSLEKCLLE